MRNALLSACFIAALPITSQAVVLYNAALGLPGSQGWLGVGNPIFGHMATQSHTGSATNLDTDQVRTDQFGYFSEAPNGAFEHPDMPIMDAGTGYTVSFELQVLFEGHDHNDRAGFSMIAISENLFGLELAFFENEVWAYNSDFTHSIDSAVFDTTAGLVQYDYTVSGMSYSVTANGAPLLNGSLRNYNPTVLDPFFDPYDNPSFLFFGDDTTSADANVLLGDIELNPLPDMAVPEPQTALPIIIIGLIALFCRKRR